MDVILAWDLTVGRNINPRFNLVCDDFLHTSTDNALGIITERIHGVWPALGRVRGIRAVGVVEPVRKVYVIRLWISTNTGGLDHSNRYPLLGKPGVNKFITVFCSYISIPLRLIWPRPQIK